MNKFRITFLISLFIILIISVGSISAENIDQDDSQIMDKNIQEDCSLNDNALGATDNTLEADLNENALETNENALEADSLNEDVLASDDLNENIVENNEGDDQVLENAENEIDDDVSDNQIDNTLLDENDADSEIAKDIKVNFSHKVYQNDTGNISIELPEEASGFLRVTIDDIEIYNETITEKSLQVPITIPKTIFPIFVVNRNYDFTYHTVGIYYNDVSLDIDGTLKVMIYEPEHGFYLNVPHEILKGDNQSYQTVGLIFPSSANGTVEVYIDDKIFGVFNTTQYVFLNISKLNSLALGSHSIKAIFSGDDYYLPCEKNGTFEVVDFLIQIPENIVLEHDDCVYAKSVKYTDGTLTVLFDGKKIYSKKLDKNHEFLESLFSKVTCGEHMIEVRYNSSKFNYSKMQAVNISYVVDIFGGNFVYGDDNSVIVMVPSDFNASLLHISIDGKSYPVKIDNSGWIDLNVSKLDAGNHTLTFDFPGDNKYYNHSETYNFTVSYEFHTPYLIDYCDGSVVSLTLPPSANGYLELYVDNKLYKSVKLNNGKASIRVDKFSCGDHNITLNYTGNDFELENISSSLTVYPKVVTPYDMNCGDNKSVLVEVSKDSKGYILFKVGKTSYKVPITNGKANLSLKNFKIGEYDFEIEYVGDDGFNCTTYAYAEVFPAEIKITGAKNLAIPYTTDKFYTVKVYNNESKLAKGVIVNFKVGKTTFKVKTDNNGVAKLRLSRFAPNTYKIVISYKGTKVSKKLTVRHILRLNAVKIRRNAKKLIFTARLNKVNGKYLKGKVIKFRFAGKTYQAKTNSKGVARVTISAKVLQKLKVGKLVSYKAIYLKDNVKRTARVLK